MTVKRSKGALGAAIEVQDAAIEALNAGIETVDLRIARLAGTQFGRNDA